MTLLEFLLTNKDNRGVLAALRKGLVPTTEPRAWPYLAPFEGIGQDRKARAVRTVAGLFAHHPENCADGNMGDTCRDLCNVNEEKPWKVTENVNGNEKPEPPGPIARKFGWMLEAVDAEEICKRVARMVLYARSKGVPVNYEQLEKDLIAWPRAREAWARHFWATQQAERADGEAVS
ncbi:MAG: type I-E CRISPR-associated protein Cse2/CasB [Desulfovibrionaceae bacterium]|nr:type I-E CRISPR-associated protein Cse2/CasB [Desulfovibrionaceae bacterium]